MDGDRIVKEWSQDWGEYYVGPVSLIFGLQHLQTTDNEWSLLYLLKKGEVTFLYEYYLEKSQQYTYCT